MEAGDGNDETERSPPGNPGGGQSLRALGQHGADLTPRLFAYMEVLPLIPGPRVLIVDEAAESREVLRTILEHRGMHILEAEDADQGLELARNEHPDLILVDLERQSGSAAALSDEFAAESEAQQTPLVLLGNLRISSPGGQLVRKPYHYAALIRTIEGLLHKAA